MQLHGFYGNEIINFIPTSAYAACPLLGHSVSGLSCKKNEKRLSKFSGIFAVHFVQLSFDVFVWGQNEELPLKYLQQPEASFQSL